MSAEKLKIPNDWANAESTDANGKTTGVLTGGLLIAPYVHKDGTTLLTLTVEDASWFVRVMIKVPPAVCLDAACSAAVRCGVAER